MQLVRECGGPIRIDFGATEVGHKSRVKDVRIGIWWHEVLEVEDCHSSEPLLSIVEV